MSIFTKVFILFCISIVLMFYVSTKTNAITDEKIELIHKEKYIQASKELFNYLVNGDINTLNKRVQELNYEIKIIDINSEELASIYQQTISFGEVRILKQDDGYLLFMRYLDDEFYFYDIYQQKEIEQKKHLNYFILADIAILIIMFLVIIGILRPLKSISKGIKKFGSGDYSSRLTTPNSKDEIGELVDRFNTMAQNLESLIISRTQFLNDISHELRTPISKAKLSLEMIEQSKYKTILKKSIDNIDELTNELLELERLNSKNLILNMEKHSIETILANALSKMIVENEEDIEVKIINIFDCVVDINYISIAIKNLIDNALKYKEGGNVEIVIDTNILEVRNYGKKLPNNLEYYMETFTQEDNSRSIKGYGLGLNIVKRVLEHHHFTLEYSYKNNQNTFRIVYNNKAI